MKLTTKRLKQLIKEELSEMMGNPMPDQYYDEDTKMMAQKIMAMDSYGSPGDGRVRMELADIGLNTDRDIEDARNKLLGGRGETPDAIAKFLTDVLSPMSRRHSY
jgi:hypothetical protein|tara:strand:+ start:132 stop:446 length:315 start_codon:yes stop_codon:yes gene_type:complete